jgi:protein-disulfide isomerase
MRTPTVNSLTRAALACALASALAATVFTTACSSAEGRAADTSSSANAVANAAANGSANVATTSAAADDSLLSARSDQGRIDGSPTAKVWVIEISDLQCPFCKKWHDTVFPKLRDEFVKTGKVRFAYVNFPLSQHKNAFAAATAAMCAGAQGKFWGMHDGLFSTQEKWEELSNPAPQFEAMAIKSGVDLTAWKACLPSPAIKKRIEGDMDRAKGAGVESTPSFIIAGRLIEGAMPWDDMKKAINDALGASGK